MSRLQAVLAVALVISLALVGGGCGATTDKATDGDRQLVHLSAQALSLAIVELHTATTAIGGLGLPTASPALAAIGKARALVADTKANVDQLAENFGPPKEPREYSPEASAAARDQAKAEHATPWWQVGLWSLGGVFVTWASTKVPLVGPLVQSVFAGLYKKALNKSVETTALLRKEGAVSKEALGDVAERVQGEGPVHDLIRDTAHAIEEKVLGGKL